MKLHSAAQEGRSGFTLVELLVVIAIIGLLAAIIFPVYGKARAKGWEATCTSNQRQIIQALLLYAQDHQDALPGKNMWSVLETSEKIFHCPAQRGADNINYVFSARAAGKKQGDFLAPVQTLLLADGVTADNLAHTDVDFAYRHGEQLIAGFADGHVGLTPKLIVNVRYPGDRLTSIEDVKTFFGFDLSLHPKDPEPNRLTVSEMTPVVLRELSLYDKSMLRQEPVKLEASLPLFDHIVLTTKPQDYVPPDSPGPYQFTRFAENPCLDTCYDFYVGEQSGVTLVIWPPKVAVTNDVTRQSAIRTLRWGVHAAIFRAYHEWGKLAIPEQEWVMHNPPGFAYQPSGLEGGYPPYNNNPTFLAYDSVERRALDMQSYYYHAIVDPAYVAERGREEPGTLKKLTLLRHYLNLRAPTMDDAFWTVLAKLNPAQSYSLSNAKTIYIPLEEDADE